MEVTKWLKPSDKRVLAQQHESTFLSAYMARPAASIHPDGHHQGFLDVGNEIAHAFAATLRISDCPGRNRVCFGGLLYPTCRRP